MMKLISKQLFSIISIPLKTIGYLLKKIILDYSTTKKKTEKAAGKTILF